MILYVTPIEWRRVTSLSRTSVQGADMIGRTSAIALRRVYRELRRSGDRRGRRGTAVNAQQARATIARLIQIGWLAGFADAAAFCEQPTRTAAKWRVLPESDLAVLG